MKTVKLSLLGIVAVALLGSCGNAELEERVGDLEEKVEKLSATEVIQNPNTANTPTNEVVIDGPVAGIAFAETEFDFGDINQGDVVKHTFKFKNTGETPLIIQNASASCGCTVPSWPRDPIAPGAEGEILVQFDSKGKTGVQNKQVTVTANTNPNTTKVNIKSNVIAPEGATPAQ